MFGTLVPTGGGDDIPLKKKELIVGRNEECDIVLRFSNVSNKHCKFVLSNGYWYVVDMNSSNGVKVNGIRVTDRRIDPGMKVVIANHAFHLDYNPTDNGAVGAPPPDLLDADVFSRSLLDRIGLNKTPERRLGSSGVHDKPKLTPQKPTIDYDALSIDDIELR
ncbi:MAG: FHA domain-containing protein [Planctomycetaceae bacterium]|nr:FHA domain-containing protein [Planctomycetaceae bacterium]MCL2304386.1 FHA domain-containing protein [Planctomycetaceae bacterium]